MPHREFPIANLTGQHFPWGRDEACLYYAWPRLDGCQIYANLVMTSQDNFVLCSLTRGCRQTNIVSQANFLFKSRVLLSYVSRAIDLT